MFIERLSSNGFLGLIGIVLLGNGLSAVLGVLALRLYTELAPPEIYGMANLILGSLTLASQCVIQPVAATQIRYHTQAISAGRAEAFTAEAVYLVMAGTALLGAAAATVLALFLSGRVSHAVGTGVAAALWLMLSGGRSIFMSRLHAEQQMRGFMTLRVCETALTIIVTISLLFLLKPHPAAFVIGQCAGIFCVLAYFAAKSRPVLGLISLKHQDAGLWPKIVEYGIPFVPLAILYWVAGLADRYVLASLMGAGAAGKYSAAFVIAAAGFGITNGIMSDLFRPKLFAAENASDHARASRIFVVWLGTYLAISLCILAGLAVLGNLLIGLVVSQSYQDGAQLLLTWISVGFSISGLTTALENRMLSYGRSQKLVLPVAVGAIANVCMSYALVRANGAVGAAQACCCSFAVQLFCTLLVLRRAAAERTDRLEAKPLLRT